MISYEEKNARLPGAKVILADLPVRKRLLKQRPYTPPQPLTPVRLNTNESPFPPSRELADDIIDSVRAELSSLNRYPDSEAASLRAALAGYVTRHSEVVVGAENVWVANGSLEILQKSCNYSVTLTGVF